MAWILVPYTNKAAATTFCHYIAQSRRLELMKTLSKAKFFSVLMDGSTDRGNVDDELFLVVLAMNTCMYYT